MTTRLDSELSLISLTSISILLTVAGRVDSTLHLSINPYINTSSAKSLFHQIHIKMVVINCAYTEQINPEGASPVLTRDQIWKGLQRKIRKAQDFVPVIESCEVLEEKENEVVREAHFKPFMDQPAHSLKEVCKSYYPTKASTLNRLHGRYKVLILYLQVEFWQPDGALIINTVSDGPSMTESDCNMTYTFEWRYPDIAEGSQAHKDNEQKAREGAKMAVHMSIEAMRKMAAAGELD